MADWIDSLIFRTSEAWQRSKTANVYTEALFCASFDPLPGLDLDPLLPNGPLAAIRVAHAWAEGIGQLSLVKDAFYIKTGTNKIIACDKPAIDASRGR